MTVEEELLIPSDACNFVFKDKKNCKKKKKKHQ